MKQSSSYLQHPAASYKCNDLQRDHMTVHQSLFDAACKSVVESRSINTVR